MYEYKNPTVATSDGIPPPEAPTPAKVFEDQVKSGYAVKQADGTYVHEDAASNTRTVYDATGNVTSLHSKFGEDVSVNRNANGEVTIQYVKDGQVLSTVSPIDVNGHTYWKNVDAHGSLLSFSTTSV